MVNDKFDVFNNFKGFGNPNGKYWFVGIEEAKDFKEIDGLREKYKKEYFPAEENEIKNDAEKYGRKYTKIYDIMSKIIVRINGNNNWKEYRDKSLLQANSNEFQMNLYPLGKKKKTQWLEDYEKEFGFSSKSQYLENVKKWRFPELQKFRKKFNPQFTICFGSDNDKDFIEAFDLKNEKSISYPKDEFLFFVTSKILITPFFLNFRMNNDRINHVVDILKTIK